MNSDRSKVKRFLKYTDSRDKFFEYMFIDMGKIVGVLGKEPSLMQIREELKIDRAREEWIKLLMQGWRRTSEVWA